MGQVPEGQVLARMSERVWCDDRILKQQLRVLGSRVMVSFFELHSKL